MNCGRQKKLPMRKKTLSSNHVTFSMRRVACRPVLLNDHPHLQSEDVKYLGMHTKRKQLEIKLQKCIGILERTPNYLFRTNYCYINLSSKCSKQLSTLHGTCWSNAIIQRLVKTAMLGFDCIFVFPDSKLN